MQLPSSDMKKNRVSLYIYIYAYSVGKRPSNRGWGDSSIRKVPAQQAWEQSSFLRIYIKKI